MQFDASFDSTELRSEKVQFSSYLYWGAKTGTVFTSTVVISQLQSIIQDQTAEVTSTGSLACLF